MLLNRIEKALMNNAVRAALQRQFEAPRLLGMGGPIDGGHALELGCGRGIGVEAILDDFRASRVDAFDLDPQMVALAEKRLANRGAAVRLWVGDAESIPSADATYDAVFDFGIIHHVPSWRNVLREVRRVLRPGGRFYAEEVLARFILNPITRRVLDHPLEDRFDHAGFVRALEDHGFEMIDSRDLAGLFGWYVARTRAETRLMGLGLPVIPDEENDER